MPTAESTQELPENIFHQFDEEFKSKMPLPVKMYHSQPWKEIVAHGTEALPDALTYLSHHVPEKNTDNYRAWCCLLWELLPVDEDDQEYVDCSRLHLKVLIFVANHRLAQ